MTPKIAFVTGASRGIGAAIAERLAQAGYHLAINSRSQDTLLQKAEALSGTYPIVCLALPGDVGEEAFVREAFEEIRSRLGPVELLVNNAGISQIGLLTELALEDWNRILATNLTSVFLCSKYAANQMLPRKSGKIINISSVWGNVGASCEAAYSASKGGVNAFTRALAKELAPSGIQVNAVACGTIDTDMNRCFDEEERRALREEIPCGRFGSPGEVAEVVLSLAEAPAYLTGQVITLDGGWT